MIVSAALGLVSPSDIADIERYWLVVCSSGLSCFIKHLFELVDPCFGFQVVVFAMHIFPKGVGSSGRYFGAQGMLAKSRRDCHLDLSDDWRNIRRLDTSAHGFRGFVVSVRHVGLLKILEINSHVLYNRATLFDGSGGAIRVTKDVDVYLWTNDGVLGP